MSTIDPRTIAADIMCGNARSITVGEIWAHIGQAYDAAEIDASIADEVAELIAKTGIDLIWPDGTKNTELDAARVEVERLRAELADVAAAIAPTVTISPTPAAARFLHQLYQDWVKTAHERLEQVDKLTAELAAADQQITSMRAAIDQADALPGWPDPDARPRY